MRGKKTARRRYGAKRTLADALAILFGAVSALALAPVFRMLPREDDGPLRIPFGPFLCLGCMLAIFWGERFMLLLAGR